MARTLTSREFNQDTSGAKQSAESGPVVITDRGRPAHVLMTFTYYKKLLKKQTNIADLLALPGVEDIALDLPPRKEVAKAANLS